MLFTDALAHKISFSPVYFRNESEPYLTIAIAGSGRNPGVTLADVNPAKPIWDVRLTHLRKVNGQIRRPDEQCACQLWSPIF